MITVRSRQVEVLGGIGGDARGREEQALAPQAGREHGLGDRALERFGLPVTHLTVAHEETV
jgi:hypothetical protein